LTSILRGERRITLIPVRHRGALIQEAARIQVLDFILSKQSVLEAIRDVTSRDYLRLHAAVARIAAACDNFFDDIQGVSVLVI